MGRNRPKKRLAILLAGIIEITFVAATDRLPDIAVYMSSAHNNKSSMHSLPKREFLSIHSIVASGEVQRRGYRPKDKRKKQLFILQGLPGVGPERAGRLLNEFGSMEGVVSASSSELQSVYGIGKNVADRIKWAVNEGIKPYGTTTASAF